MIQSVMTQLPRKFMSVTSSPISPIADLFTTRPAQLLKPLAQDVFESNSITRYFDPDFILSQISKNDNIKAIAKKFGFEVVPNLEELASLKSGHMSDVAKKADMIINALDPDLAAKVDRQAVKEAAMLHDIGKVIIPSEVLNKSGKLTPEEFEIMQLHSTFSYEILKDTDVNKKTLDLIKYHHQNPNLTGYPPAIDGYKTDINQEILSLADKYSALRETRVYRKGLSRKKSLSILSKEIETKGLSPTVFKALIRGTLFSTQG